GLPARVVHAPERAASGLRVRLRRRQSAGARLGGVAGLQDGRGPRRAGPPFPRSRVPEVRTQLHLVGEPQGRRRAQPLRRRLPRSPPHPRLRPLPAPPAPPPPPPPRPPPPPALL